jgi:hypothetical protein
MDNTNDRFPTLVFYCFAKPEDGLNAVYYLQNIFLPVIFLPVVLSTSRSEEALVISIWSPKKHGEKEPVRPEF